ncbi:hypothetical protein K443DRAFT_686797 [Laccaria amethystina LaAM-08-1]|uniref:Uncharacterized protein n=1 Tax=Laccaria amethystina LaAM-08-1 TaxID=1095629 RepID=A0A0C9WRA1_9AGAR|nr:hypothetical protein K443DRAFT_686797 [Laccaria amethystina LaAM-08-1]
MRRWGLVTTFTMALHALLLGAIPPSVIQLRMPADNKTGTPKIILHTAPILTRPRPPLNEPPDIRMPI